MNIESDVLESVVEFMKGADGVIAKQASMEATLSSEAEGLVDSCVSAGLLPEATKEASVQKIKEDPTYMVDLLKKAASSMETIEPAGAGADNVKVAGTNETAGEAFDRVLFS